MSRRPGNAGRRPDVITYQRQSRKSTVIAAVVLVALVVGIGFGMAKVLKPADLADEGGGALFANDTAYVAQPTQVTLTFAGDCTLGTDENFNASTSFNAKFDEMGDPAWFFKNVYDIFAADDLSIVNMEGTLTTGGARQDKQFAFKGDPEFAQVLVRGGIEAASVANNHSKDYGAESLTDTKDVLEAAGIDAYGYDDIAYIDVKGVKVALIGTYELAQGAGIKDSMDANIQKAKDAGAQIITVYLHWGNEREYVPESTQIELGHAAVDAGADLVIGSHPHVIQGYEKYNGRYIVYSLGNFCFGGNKNPSDKDCMIFQQTFTVTGDDVATDDVINVIPCSVSSVSGSNNYQPTPLEGDEKARVERKIAESNAAIATKSAKMQGN